MNTKEIDGRGRVVTTYAEALGAWLERANAMVREHFAANYPNSKPPTIELDGEGTRYQRVVRNDGVSRSAWAFIDRETGDVLKPDGFKRPAKGARGSVYDLERPGIGPHGALYAR